MKVKSYLELKIFLQEVKEGTKDIIEQGKLPEIMRVNWCGSDLEFYSKKFYPEMIVELFEGWVYDRPSISCHRYTYNDLTVFVKITFFEQDNSYTISDVDDDIIEYFNPRTLDDLINDCQRVGIELHWKEVKNESN